MPKTHFIAMLLGVLIAAALTVWVLTCIGPSPLIVALPAFMIAALVVKVLRR